MQLGFDHEVEITPASTLVQALDHRDSAVIGILHAANHLNASGIILGAERREVVEQARLIAVQRLENGDIRGGSGACAAALAHVAADQKRSSDQITAANECDQRGRDRGPERAQRSGSTRDWRARSEYFGTSRPHSNICQPSSPGTPTTRSAARLTRESAIACSGGMPNTAHSKIKPPSCAPSAPGMAKAAPRTACKRLSITS